MTNFLKRAKKLGHQTLNSESMFLYQAQKSFELWHSISPKIDKFLIDYLKMIRIALVRESGLGSLIWQNYLVIQFLKQIWRFRKFIKKTRIFLLIYKRN